MRTENTSNNENLYADIDEAIERLKIHDKESQSLYDTFYPVVELSIKKSMNSLTVGGKLREISSGVEALSKVRSDAISATNSVVQAAQKRDDLKLKRERLNVDETQNDSIASLMRDLTSAAKDKNFRFVPNVVKTNKMSEEEDKLFEARIAKDKAKGKLKMNANELNMKHDFNGVTFRWDDENERTVAINAGGQLIDNYPEERIPEGERFNHKDGTIPISNSGKNMLLYKG